MRRILWALLLVGGAGVLAASCGDGETADGTTCTPGEEIFCRCKGGGDATKTCLDDGESFGECGTVDGPCPDGEEDDDDGDDDDDSDGETFCTPFEETACTCGDGSAGLQECDDEGASFGECTAAGVPCGGGATTTATASSSSSGGGGTTLLFEPCGGDGECVSGSCAMGFCTQECGNLNDCIDDGGVQGECVRFEGGALQICAPYCEVQGDCIDLYGDQSRCGYGVTTDTGEWFLACGDWGSDLEVPPLGTPCAEDYECHLNLYGAERVCYFDECIEGCYVADDCPERFPECSSGGATPGTCG
jgi:hypothetical protein